MKTKITALLLLIAVVLSFCACDLGNIIPAIGGHDEEDTAFADALALVRGVIGTEPAKTDIALPTSYKNLTFSYESSDPAVLSPDGKVTRGIEDTKVYLTVRISDGSKTQKTILDVTVAKTERTVADLLTLLNQTYDAIVAGIPTGKLTGNILLPSSMNGFTLTYASSDPAAISASGAVLRGNEDKYVTLTVNFTCGDFSSSKDIALCVAKAESEGPTADELRAAFQLLKNGNMQILSTVAYDYREGDEYDGIEITLFTYADGITAWEDDSGYTYYLYENSKNVLTLTCVDPDGEIEHYPESHSAFDSLLSSSLNYDYRFDLDASAYVYENGWLIPKAESLVSEAQELIGAYEGDEIVGLKLRYENGCITEILLETVYTQVDDGITYVCDYEYDLLIGGFGLQKIDLLPIETDDDGYTVTDLELAISMLADRNFTVDSTVSYDYREDDDYDGIDATLFRYADGIVYWEDGYGYENFLYENASGVLCLVTGTKDDGFETYTEYDSEFEDYLSASCYYEYSFDLDASCYEYVEGWFVPKAAYLTSEAQKIIGEYDGEEILSLMIRLEKGNIAEIRVTTLYNEEYDSEVFHCDYAYTLLIDGIGKQEIELPDDTGSSEGNSIADLYKAKEGDAFTLSGWVAGIVKNNVYITDGTNSCVVYFPNTSSNYASLKRGDYITVGGTYTAFKGLNELKATGNAVIDASAFRTLENETLTSFDGLNDETKQGSVYDFENLTVIKPFASSSGDISMEVSDGKTTMVFFIKSALASLGKELFSSLKAGDTFSVCNIGIGCYNAAQLTVLSETGIVTDGLTVNPGKMTVGIGTSLDDVKAALTVSYRKGGKQQTVAIADCTVTGTYNGNTAGSYTLTVTYGGYTAKVTVTVKQKTEAFTPEDAEILLDVINSKKNLSVGIPSVGDVNVLVIPIAFSNVAVPADCKETIEKGFNGTSEETGWESLNSYYKKSSYGKLNITATVTDVYQTGEKYNASLDYDSAKDLEWLHEALAYFDSTIDYNDYDSNDDGNIDCVYLVYIGDINYDDDESIWWAYTSYDDEPKTFDGLDTDFFMFFSYYFFLEDPQDAYGDTVKDIAINAETVIHETGHALGLDDYYDYDEYSGSAKLLGGGAMMDYNVGDHDAYSKTILGWTVPTVVVDSDYTVTLASFGATGDAVIIAKDWNGSFFDEYYIIDYYTADGLNALQAGNCGLPSVNGIRILHVMAGKNDSIEDVWSITACNNSDTKTPLLSLVEADNNGSIAKDGLSSDSDLFAAGGTYSPKWYDGTSAGCTVTVDSIGQDGATVTIDFE